MTPEGTAVLDTTGLRIMPPHVAERILPTFTQCLRNNHIKALAYVSDPDNAVLKMQFQRVLKNVEGATDFRHKTFHEQQKAEDWLDEVL